MVWTLGAMGFLGVPITLVTTVMPVILLAMTVADEVHLLERLQVDLDAVDGHPPEPCPINSQENFLDTCKVLPM